jgi:hypothetical protein
MVRLRINFSYLSFIIFSFTHSMKNLVFLLLVSMLIASSAMAQNRRKPVSKRDADTEVETRTTTTNKKPELKTFKDRLWYGGGFGLGGANSSFVVNVSPMVGYKVLPFLSLGPRVDFSFNSVKLLSNGTYYRANLISYSLGAFTRAAIWGGVFAQAEFNRESKEYPIAVNSNGKIETTREFRNVPSIGLGYNRGGGGFGSDIYVMFDLIDDPKSPSVPFNPRFGFTYKF